MLTRSQKRRTARDDSGETLVSVIVAMVITGLVMPAVLHMIYVTAQMAAAQPVHDPAVAATSQLQSVFAEIDPVRVCLSPAGTGRRDQCLTTSEAVGASLVQPPPDALGIDPMTICWLARPDNPDTPSPQIETGLKTQCLMLRDDGNDTPFAPNARRETSETDRQISAVDPRGGDELIVRTYDIAVPPGGDPAVAAEKYLLPVAAAQSWADQVIYFDVEWWCLRWRHPKADSIDGAIVGRWIGNCPCPSDTFEQIPLHATVKTLTDPDGDSLTVHWVPPPAWADTDGTLTSGAPPDDGDPYNNVAELASATGTCDRVAATRPDGTVNPDHCNASAGVGTLPGVPILGDAPVAGDDCATDAWWNPRYSTETVDLRGYLLPAAAVPAGGGPPIVLSRVASMEIRVCVATTADTRNRGGAHCELDTMRFALPGFDRLSTSSAPNPVTLSLSGSALSILENTSGHIDVALTAPPTGPVTVKVASADLAIATVSPVMLTFSPVNYGIPQRITIDGVVDVDAVDGTTTVTLTADGGGYSAASVAVPVTITEPQPPAMVVSGPVTTAENNVGTFTVALATRPTGPVMVTAVSADIGVATVTAVPLTFTDADYGVDQTFTVTGVHDANIVRDTTIINLSAVGGDYAGVSSTVAVTITDIDTPALIVDPAAVTMDEGGTARFTVALAAQPSGQVIVEIASNDATIATVSTPELTFGSSDYSTEQTVIVTGVRDVDLFDSNTFVTVIADSTYNGVSSSVTVIVTELAVPVLNVDPLTVTMQESDTATFTVALGTEPAGPVMVSVASDNPTVATVSTPALNFNPLNYSNPQNVTVTGVTDIDTDASTANVTVTAGSNYDSLFVTVGVTVTEAPLPALVLSAVPVNAQENSPTEFSVALAAPPTGTVTVQVVSDDPSVATVTPDLLTFDSGNYNTAQIVTVTGVHDINTDDAATTVDLAADGANYVGITDSVAVTVTDIDPDAVNAPASPTNGTITCNATGATVSWDAPSGGPTHYEVNLDFYHPNDSNEDESLTRFVSHPETSIDFALGSGYYAATGVTAHNSAGSADHRSGGGLLENCP